jgi:hypothetical protein
VVKESFYVTTYQLVLWRKKDQGLTIFLDVDKLQIHNRYTVANAFLNHVDGLAQYGLCTHKYEVRCTSYKQSSHFTHHTECIKIPLTSIRWRKVYVTQRTKGIWLIWLIWQWTESVQRSRNIAFLNSRDKKLLLVFVVLYDALDVIMESRFGR